MLDIRLAASRLIAFSRIGIISSLAFQDATKLTKKKIGVRVFVANERC